MAFSRDNQSAFISDIFGNIKMIKWQAGANSGDNFDFTEEHQKVGGIGTEWICLTKNEKYLLVGSYRSVFVFETETREVTMEFDMTNQVVAVSLIKDYTKAVIAESNGNLAILDLVTMQIFEIAENITNGKGLNKIVVV